jgi:hypothetical protein
MTYDLAYQFFLSCVNSLPFYIKMNENYVRNTNIVIIIMMQHHMSMMEG